jgi:hypothetical protein
LISFTIEESDLGEDYYRVTVGRYDYSEIFEGTLTPVIGEEDRLDFKISKNSKLVSCELLGGDKLRLGEYKLRGATIEETTPEMFVYSLDVMLSDDSSYPDFFLVPDKYKYIKNIDLDNNYFGIYDSKEIEAAKKCFG